MSAKRMAVVLWAAVAALLVAVLFASQRGEPALVTGALLAVLIGVLVVATARTLRLPAARSAAAPRTTASAFEAIVSIAADAIISVDDEHRIVVFNEGAERIFRYRFEDVRGERLDMLLPERFRAVHRRHMQAFATGGTNARRMGEREEIVGLRANGEEFPAEASISRVHIDGERYLTVLLRDVSDRKKAEARERFLAQSTEVLTASLDYDETLRRLARLAVPGLADWCVIYLEEDGELRRLETAHADPDKDALLARLRAYAMDPSRPHPVFPVIETGEAELIEEFPPSLMASIAQDEEHLELLQTVGIGSVIIVPLGARDETLGAIALVNDPGGRRFLPEDLALAQEMGDRAALAVDNAGLYRQARTAIAARDEVMSVVSHDLGNPLSAIFVGTRLLRRRLDGPGEDAAALRQVDDIRRAAEQMERLINDLLEIQRIEAGHLVIEPEPCFTGALLEDAGRTLKPLAEEKNIELRWDDRTGPDAAVHADPSRILQVLSNLVGNAIKFTPEGGRVVVSVENGSEVTSFAVTDTGPGIAPAELPHVFDRFWQSRQRYRHGVGMGLAIAKAIVEAHGGSIAVESEEGSGSTFRFTLLHPPPGADATDDGAC